MPKEKVKWGDDLFTKLIKDYENVIFKISEDREKAIRESLENCEEVKLFKFEDTSKKKVNSAEKVLSSTFSTMNTIVAKKEISIQEQLKEAGINLPDQLTEENLKSLFIEPKTNQSKEIGKSTKTKIADMIDSLKNNKFFKFLVDIVVVGFGRMHFKDYIPNISQLLREKGSKVFDDKTIETLKNNTNDPLLKLVTSSISNLEKRNSSEPKKELLNLAEKFIIEKSIEPKNYTNDELIDGKSYLIQSDGELSFNNNDLINVKKDNIVSFNNEEFNIVEISKEDIDLFNTIFFIFNKLSTKNGDNKIYSLVNQFEYTLQQLSLNYNNFKPFIKQIDSVINDTSVQNKMIKRSNIAKIYKEQIEQGSEDFVFGYLAFIKTGLNLEVSSTSKKSIKNEETDISKDKKYFDNFISKKVVNLPLDMYSIANNNMIFITPNNGKTSDKKAIDLLIKNNIIQNGLDPRGIKENKLDDFIAKIKSFKNDIFTNIEKNFYHFNIEPRENYIYKNIITTTLLKIKNIEEFLTIDPKATSKNQKNNTTN
jgi:hypothetical protein